MKATASCAGVGRWRPRWPRGYPRRICQRQTDWTTERLARRRPLICQSARAMSARTAWPSLPSRSPTTMICASPAACRSSGRRQPSRPSTDRPATTISSGLVAQIRGMPSMRPALDSTVAAGNRLWARVVSSRRRNGSGQITMTRADTDTLRKIDGWLVESPRIAGSSHPVMTHPVVMLTSGRLPEVPVAQAERPVRHTSVQRLSSVTARRVHRCPGRGLTAPITQRRTAGCSLSSRKARRQLGCCRGR